MFRLLEGGLLGTNNQRPQRLHEEDEGPWRRVPLHQHYPLPKAEEELRVYGQRAIRVAPQGLVEEKQEKPELRLPHRLTDLQG